MHIDDGSGWPATGTIGFGMVSVSGRIRTPRPAARTMALVGVTDIRKSSRTIVSKLPQTAADTGIRVTR
jgi:hypothetical protein